jgi:hypothetical protein
MSGRKPETGGDVHTNQFTNEPGSGSRRRSRSMMRVRTLWIFSGLAVAALLAVGAAQGGSTTGSRAAAAAKPATKTPNEADQVRATERTRLHALVAADVTLARSLMADDAQVVNPLGGTLEPDDYMAALASGDIDYLVFEPTSPIVVRLHGGSAALRFQVSFDLVVFGRHLTHAAWLTELYERQHGRWQLVWEQATAIPNDVGLFLDSISPKA